MVAAPMVQAETVETLKGTTTGGLSFTTTMKMMKIIKRAKFPAVSKDAGRDVSREGKMPTLETLSTAQFASTVAKKVTGPMNAQEDQIKETGTDKDVQTLPAPLMAMEIRQTTRSVLATPWSVPQGCGSTATPPSPPKHIPREATASILITAPAFAF